jgi:peptidyl-dipeptidase Dcp
MKRIIMLLLTFGLFATACEIRESNPFLNEWDTPFGTPPFEQIKSEHYLPAFEESIKKHNAEIDAIINNKEEATFTNTIVALDNSGTQLDRVERVFNSMTESMSNDKMQEISKTVTPMLAMHNDDVNLNEGLFERVKSVYEKKKT